MKLSAERQSYLSQKITQRILQKSLVRGISQEDLFQKIKSAVHDFVQEWEETEQAVIKKIQSIQRGVQQGSSEWDVLYSQFLEESFRKKSKLFVKK